MFTFFVHMNLIYEYSPFGLARNQNPPPISNNGGPKHNNFGMMNFVKMRDGHLVINDNNNNNNINVPINLSNGSNNVVIMQIYIVNNNLN